MIATLNGKLIIKELNYVVVECGGVGIKCFVTQHTHSTVGNIGDNVFLYTYLVVREDALDLYGFSDNSELEVFKLITSVSGVGSKIGLAILSEFTADKIMLYIASGDAKSLTAASGVGIKLAQRIVLELKDKVGSVSLGDASIDVKSVGNATANSSSKEAIEALVSLGYTQSEASLAVGRLDQSLDTNELIKQALKSLARGL
ncbi:MAG: Holliday junction branch migration protein RuvA [Clostridia bacterium]|nr:Holliday junction branch migration protein RuvA [Clostridia bacterium]MBR4116860.1 Holliday junction branch migration protein RuvA [Clostridia bacterium]